jgi:hypothetical protein
MVNYSADINKTKESLNSDGFFMSIKVSLDV